MADYTLYGWTGAGSACIEAALAEAGAGFKLVPVDTGKKEHHDAAFTAVNPRQQIPALVLPDGTVITECAAILLHIADAFPKAKLAPPPGSSARATHDRWLVYFAVNVYEGELRKAYSDRYTENAGEAHAVAVAAGKYVQRHYAIFEEQVRETPFFFGGQLSVLDIYLWMLVQWMDRDWLAQHCPRVLVLADAVKARPAVRPIQRAHFGAP